MVEVEKEIFDKYLDMAFTLDELKRIYPKIVGIVKNWQSYAEAHGMEQTDEDKKHLRKYVMILKKLGVLK